MLKHAPWSTRAAGIMIGRRGVCAEPTQVQFETKYNIPHQTVAKNIGTNTPRESDSACQGWSECLDGLFPSDLCCRSYPKASRRG